MGVISKVKMIYRRRRTDKEERGEEVALEILDFLNKNLVGKVHMGFCIWIFDSLNKNWQTISILGK